MARLYIANCTKQIQQVAYRLDFNADGTPNTRGQFQPHRSQDIPPGKQVQLGGDFHMSQVDNIVEQLVPYGMVGAIDVAHAGKKVIPLVFNVDKPVPAEIMRRVVFHNDNTQIGEGAERRAKAAVANNQLVQNVVANEFANQGIDLEPSDKISFGVEQLEQSEAGERTIAEGFKVAKEGTVTGPSMLQQAREAQAKKKGRPRKIK